MVHGLSTGAERGRFRLRRISNARKAVFPCAPASSSEIWYALHSPYPAADGSAASSPEKLFTGRYLFRGMRSFGTGPVCKAGAYSNTEEPYEENI